MALLRITIALFVSVTFSSLSLAGVEPDSSIERPGMFFAWLPWDGGPERNVLVHFEDPEMLRSLIEHCNASGEVFSLQTGASSKCRPTVFKSPSGDGYLDEAGIALSRSFPKTDPQQFDLFSTSPPRTVNWVTRRISTEEVTALRSLLASDAGRFATMKTELQVVDATAYRRRGGARLTIVVPGKTFEDPDAFYSSQAHHVFVKRGKSYSYLGALPGKPIGVVDVDRSDYPGFVAAEDCDGMCITLWSITRGLHQLGWFGGH